MTQKEFVIEKSIEILKQESKLFPNNHWCIPEIFDVHHVDSVIEKLYGLTCMVIEIARSSTVPRSYNKNYHLSSDEYAYESVGAHTNLVMYIIDHIIDIGWATEEAIEEYSQKEIREAIWRHDLAENITGDTPDNGIRDEKAKSKSEHAYWSKLRKYAIRKNDSFEDRVQNLLDEMETKSTIIGRMLYVADKISAPIATLVQDIYSSVPIKTLRDKDLTPLEIEAINNSDTHENNFAKASEMWAYGYFVSRKTIQYDDVGFFTAILVMATLILNGDWYQWREKTYRQP